MTTIHVAKIAGDTCITIEQGEPVYAQLQEAMRGDQRVTLDFQGVVVCASPFLNASVGRLLKDFSPEDLARLMVIENMTPTGMELVRRVIANSNSYYRDPDARRALEDILNEESEPSDASGDSGRKR